MAKGYQPIPDPRPIEPPPPTAGVGAIGKPLTDAEKIKIIDFTLQDAVKAFLSGWFDQPAEPFRTQREALSEGHRQLGYAQAQSHLRQLLAQSPEGVELSRTPAHKDAPKPVQVGDLNLWSVPEFDYGRNRGKRR